jgi:Ca2+-binding RTX toxin-like protein
LQGTANLNGIGNAGNNTLEGNSGANSLVGGAGDDRLDGMIGADTMEGGLGSDIYTVDNIADVVTELADEGIDFINSSVSYSLSANVERLFLTGTANLSGTGNELHNTIYGNSGDNVLNGGSGNDTLNGQAGNDSLDGGLGNDNLKGGLGNDSYLFGLNAGQDTIDNADAGNGNDRVLFGAGIAADQVWLRQVDSNLEVSIIGTNDRLLISDWYTNPAKQVDSFELSNGTVLLAAEVQTLVAAMAAFAPPTLGQTSLNGAQHAALDNVIAVSW